MKLRAAACLYAALLLALGAFASSALAGDHSHGGGSDHGHGNQPSQQSQSSSTDSTSTDNSQGVKPSNSTSHDTHASASSNQTKKYGNGKTAGQIATKAGYGNATLHGPGNSQPHKVNCGGHEVDVHALKHKSCGDVSGGSSSTPATTTPAPVDHKVTICHATGSATNPYVEITVDYHALKNGHTAAKGDIIPAPDAGCPKPAPAPVTTTTAGATEDQSCTVTKTVEEKVVVGVKHFIGPKGSGRFVIIHPSPSSAHYRDKHPDEFVYQTLSKTETSPSACPSTTTTEVTTTTAAVTTTTEAATTTTAAAVVAPPAATPPAAPAGSVLGATAPLHTSSAKPATGGVLGATVRLGRKVGGSTLPFTGLPLWIFALVAAGLILVGAFARRAGAEPR